MKDQEFAQKQVESIIIPAISVEDDYDTMKASFKKGLKSIITVETALGDGWQINDLLVVPGVADKIRQIISDGQLFVNEFLKINGRIAVKTITEAASELVQEGETFGPVSLPVMNGLYALATTYQKAEDAFYEGKEQWEMFQDLFQGKNIMPQLS